MIACVKRSPPRFEWPPSLLPPFPVGGLTLCERISRDLRPAVTLHLRSLPEPGMHSLLWGQHPYNPIAYTVSLPSGPPFRLVKSERLDRVPYTDATFFSSRFRRFKNGGAAAGEDSIREVTRSERTRFHQEASSEGRDDPAALFGWPKIKFSPSYCCADGKSNEKIPARAPSRSA